MDLRTFLSVYDLLAVVVLFALLGGTLLCCRSSLWAKAAPEGRWSSSALALMLFSAVLVRLFWVHHEHQVFFDELYHLDAASNIAAHFRFTTHGAASSGGSGPVHLPPYMPGFQTLLALVFLVFGAAASHAFAFNAVLSSLTVAVFFAVGKMLHGRDGDGLILAGLLCFQPLHLQFSGCANLEPASLLFASFAVISLLLFLRVRTWTHGALAMMAAACACAVRSENIVLAALTWFIVWRRIAIDWRMIPGLRRLLVLGISIPVLMAPLYVSQSLPYAWRHLGEPCQVVSVSAFLLEYPWTQGMIALVALVGLRSMWQRNRTVSGVLGLSFLGTMFIYTAVRNADVSHGDLVRYHVCVSVFVLALATCAVGPWLHPESSKKKRVWAFVFVGAYLLGCVVEAPDFDEIYDTPKHQQVRLIRSVAEHLPKNVIVCTDETSMVHWSSGLDTIESLQLVNGGLRVERPLVFYDHWKGGMPRRGDRIAQLSEEYVVTPLKLERAGGETFGFYALRHASSPLEVEAVCD